jgi:hypothetical protein
MARSPIEIIAALARGPHHRFGHYEISALKTEWERSRGTTQAFMDFVPIRLVTILEATIRAVVTEAVNHGDPYASRAISLIAKWPSKVLVDALVAIKDKRLTLGDLISHGFSSGRVSEIVSTLQTVFGDGFRDDLAAITERWTDDEGKVLSPIIADLNVTFQFLDRLLLVRHIVVHERPRGPVYTDSELSDWLTHAQQFAEAIDWILVKYIRGTVPRSTYQMNVHASKELAQFYLAVDDGIGEQVGC